MPASDSWGSTYRLKNTGMLKEWHMAARRSSIKAARNKKRNLVRRLQIDSLERRDLLAVDFTLQILHASDMEAGLAAVDDAPQFAAIVDALEDTYPNSILLSSGDNYLSGPFFNASGDPSLEAVLGGGSSASIGRGDIEIMNRIGFDASVIGNHEFDLGPRELRNVFFPSGAWRGGQFPYVSANVNYSAEPDLNSRLAPVAWRPARSRDGSRPARSLPRTGRRSASSA